MNSNTPNPVQKHSLAGLLTIMATLRSPSGCPWDREQTEQTLKKFLIEEAYEAIEALETGTPEAVKEELGDLLLQIVFLSRIAEERGQFDFSDVVQVLAEKLIRRHPHVFPPKDEKGKPFKPKNAREVARLWGTIKEQEGKYAKGDSLLAGLPLGLPALERARRISERASKANLIEREPGVLWKEIEDELALLSGNENRQSSKRSVETNLGNLLLALVHWAALKGISAEESLRKANRRFADRVVRLGQENPPKKKTRVHSGHLHFPENQ